MSTTEWRERLAGRDAGRPRRGDRHLRGADRAAQAGQDRGEGLRRDAPPPRRLRPALRQRPAPRRRRQPASSRFPAGELTKGPETLWDAPGHAAHQDPLRRAHPRAARVHRRAGRGVLRRDPPRHHAPGHPAPLRPHRRHARPDAPPGRGRHHHARGLRQRGAQRDRPARSPASATPRPSTSRPTRTALFRFLLGHPDTQDFGRKFKIAFSGCARRGLRPGDDARPRRHRPKRDRGRRERAASSSTSAAASAPSPHQAKLLYEFRPEEELLPTVQAISRVFAPPRREGEPQPRAHQVPGREARHRGVPPPRARGARDPAPRRRAGPRTSPTSRASTRRPRARRPCR